MNCFRCVAAAFLSALLSSCGSAGGSSVVREVEYNGWKCVELANERLTVVVAPEIGGRIIQLRLDGFEYLWVNRDLAGQVRRYPEGGKGGAPALAKLAEWANYGGDKLWPGPQGWSGPAEWPGPPDPIDRGGRTDHGPFRLEVLSRGPSEAAVRLVGPDDLYAGIRFEREIRLRAGSTTVDLRSAMVNISARPVRWGIWQVAQHDALARETSSPSSPPREGTPPASDLSAWAPMRLGSKFLWGYKVMNGPEDNPQFKVEPSPVPGRKLFGLRYAHQVGKVGLDCSEGWLAVTHEDSGYLFCHTFPAEPEMDHPDGSSVEFWASGPGRIQIAGKTVEMGPGEPWLVESEVLSPFALLQPGQRFEYPTSIHLARGKGPVIEVAAAAAVLRPIEWKGMGGLSGKIAVFEDGTLLARVFSAGAKPPAWLGEARAGETMDLEENPWADAFKSSGIGSSGGPAVLELISPAGVTLTRLPIRERAR